MVSSKRLISSATLLLLLINPLAFAGGISEAQWLQLKELRGISSGASGSTAVAYVLFDPNCPYSAELSKNPLGLPGMDLRKARWIPVAYIRPNSANKAVALLRAGNYAAIIKNYQNFNYAKYAGSIEGVEPTVEESLALDKSNALWNSMSNSPATPMIIYKEKSGAIKIQFGLPSRQAGGDQSMGAYVE